MRQAVVAEATEAAGRVVAAKEAVEMGVAARVVVGKVEVMVEAAR